MPTAVQGSKCVRRELTQRKYQVRARYQVRANPLLSVRNLVRLLDRFQPTPPPCSTNRCGPWSTARSLLLRRAQVLQERSEELGGAAPPPLVKWEPQKTERRNQLGAGAARRRGAAAAVPTLQAG